jgi:hypothetical protein
VGVDDHVGVGGDDRLPRAEVPFYRLEQLAQSWLLEGESSLVQRGDALGIDVDAENVVLAGEQQRGG